MLQIFNVFFLRVKYLPKLIFPVFRRLVVYYGRPLPEIITEFGGC